jgi:hypothetical protein
MPSWKKIIVSGSDAQLSNVNIGGTDTQYDTGLFDSFTSQTNVAAAVQNINDVLAGLAPQQAPEASTLGLTAATSPSRILAFNDSSKPAGYTGAEAAATAIGRTSVGIGGTFTNSTTRIGTVYLNLSGTVVRLNETVAANAGTYTNYNQYAFKTPADPSTTPETYSIWLNGTKLNDYVVSTTTGFSTSSGNPATPIGTFTLSPAKSAQFTTSGNELTLFKHRSGSFTFGTDTTLWRTGYNYLTISQSYGGTLYDTNYIDWINDDNAVAISATTFTTQSVLFTSASNADKWLSGIKYGTNLSFLATSSINNYYANTYTNATHTYTLSGTRYSNALSGSTISDIATFTIPTPASTASKVESSASFTVTRAHRVLGEQLTLNSALSHTNTEKSTINTTINFVPRFLFDPISLTANTDAIEYFGSENYRIAQDTISGLSAATFASGSYNNNNLIVVNGALRRPLYLTSRAATDLTAYAPGYSANPSSITTGGTKTFNRKFNLGASVVAKIVVSVTGDDIIYSGTGANRLVFKFVSPDTLGLETFTNIENGSSILQGAMPSDRTSHGTDTFTINLGALNIPANSWFAIQIESAGAWTGYISQLSVAIGS